eukprot:5522769-Prymnesium_polylepis.1
MPIGRAEAAARARHGTAADVGDSGRASGRTSRRSGESTSHCDCSKAFCLVQATRPATCPTTTTYVFDYLVSEARRLGACRA